MTSNLTGSVQSVSPRPYVLEDSVACLAVFDSNVPHFFAEAERAQYAEFLTGLALQRPYLVFEDGTGIIACGGLETLPEKRTAFLSWGMVARDHHGKGVGRLLTQARLELARNLPDVDSITLNTSQHTKGFYEKFGFVMTEVTPDCYAVGLDRWDMVLTLK
ncbi:GNAT family N-acetyltransferase [Rhizobium sp. RM]|uniref:GNAT family N-acetyltransferase n=1 Tax=Rhizobium sp. RM TaxID=2748079 RepID=UPI00110E0DC5|nr:GNAT family N-acetyltransferase [Rhizobium sp. RM]NWJ23074.1 GNAT family N-acetyltransferase [Rhizobium sp. RM]TMV12044.1 GNAT family N-acetyltransferase [Rhizobium sp. Td3]